MKFGKESSKIAEKDKLLRKEIKSKILKESNTDSVNKHTFMEFETNRPNSFEYQE